MSNEKQAYAKKLRAQLDEWSAEVDRLKAKARGESADLQIEYEKELKEVEKKLAAAEKKLEKLEEAGSDAWEDLKGGLEGARTNLGNAVKSAAARFKK